jgi:hypothetical protein
MKLKGYLRHIIIYAIVISSGTYAIGQEVVDYDDLLQRIDTIENPVYKPVISISYGSLNFQGDVRNNIKMPVVGNPGIKFRLSTFVDDNHHFDANFHFLTGVLSGNQVNPDVPSQNLNFSSRINAIGGSVRYNFAHLFTESLKFRPYIELGIEQFNFDTQGDWKNSEDEIYHYWEDGTIRNISESDFNSGGGPAIPLRRDYLLDGNLRFRESELGGGLGQYNNRSFAIPLGLGFSMDISERIAISIGTEYHYTFTDYIDNVAAEGTSVEGGKGKDGFFYTMATLHFDMFSEPKTRTVDLLFADVELDPIFYDDEDGDFVLDVADRCPGTPYGITTDTTGCPFDNDNDGVPNYKDKEQESAPGAWVDEKGVTISEEAQIDLLARDYALKREDLDAYMAIFEYKFLDRFLSEIPENFSTIDLDEDGYISFDELLKVIDSYFDYSVDLSLEDLHQVNEFFFSQ